MPTFAWLAKTHAYKEEYDVCAPMPHTCFAMVPYFADRRFRYTDSIYVGAPRKFVLYVSCHGPYEDAVLFAEKVNESVLNKYPFTLTAHAPDKDSPFGPSKWTDKSAPLYYGPKTNVSYWAIEWPLGTQWDLVYAVTKLIFKNITYGNRTNSGDSHGDMMRILREGGNIFEAIYHQCQYNTNGYGYPHKIFNSGSAKAWIKFIKDGPSFKTTDWSPVNVLGNGVGKHLMGFHKPFDVTEHGVSLSSTKLPGKGQCRQSVSLQQLRDELQEAARGN